MDDCLAFLGGAISHNVLVAKEVPMLWDLDASLLQRVSCPLQTYSVINSLQFNCLQTSLLSKSVLICLITSLNKYQ